MVYVSQIVLFFMCTIFCEVCTLCLQEIGFYNSHPKGVKKRANKIFMAGLFYDISLHVHYPSHNEGGMPRSGCVWICRRMEDLNMHNIDYDLL